MTQTLHHNCPQCKSATLALMEMDSDLRRTARQAERGRDMTAQITRQKHAKRTQQAWLANHLEAAV